MYRALARRWLTRCERSDAAGLETVCSRMAVMNLLKWLKGKSGSGSSRKNSLRAPVMTWTSSHWPSSKSSSSVGTWQEHSMSEHSRGRRWTPAAAVRPENDQNIWCERYRDRPWSVVSVWWRGSRSLCTARRCPNLSVRQQPVHISATHWQHGDMCRQPYDPAVYLSSPRLWHISPQNVEPLSAPVHTAWPGGSQTRCLRPEETHGGKKIRSLWEILLTSGK